MFTRRTAGIGTIALGATLFAASAWSAPDTLTTPADLAAAKTTANSIVQTPPFSFVYDGKSSADLLARWQQQSEDKKLDDNRTQTTTTWKDASGLTARLVSVRYADFPAVEWTAYLKNDGSSDTKIVENFRGIDAKIGSAPATAGATKRKSWSVSRDFPQSATGGPIELYRGWFGNFRALTVDSTHAKRFATDGHEPWIAADPSGGGVIIMPAQGIEGATDAPGSGKSPCIGFSVPADGVYRFKGSVTSVGTGGDGVDFFLGDSDGRIYGSGGVDSGKNAAFDHRVFLIAGQHFYLAAHSRGTPVGDQCRVKFDVTQLTDVVAGDVIIGTQKGADARDTDYEPVNMGLGAGETIAVASMGGRPSDAAAIPYFNVQMPQASALIAIGWPGQWDAAFVREADDVRLSAGQENVKTILHAGEEIRTPLIALMNYTGDDAQRGQNLWRRWMVAHNLPRVDGKIIGPIVSANSSHETGEMIHANEKNQIEFNDRYVAEKIKLDFWWMDAGWYINSGEWQNTGTWKVDTARFPNGLRAVSDHDKPLGVKTIVWFEPERVTKHTELYDEHPNFLLSGIQDLSDPAAGMIFLRGGAGTSEPCIGYNPTDRERRAGMVRWEPKAFTMHPGPNGEYAVTRFTAPANGSYRVSAKYEPADPRATTDVHILSGGKTLLDGQVMPKTERAFNGAVMLKKGDTLDFVVGRGANKDYTCDTTALAAILTGPGGEKFDVSKDFISDGKPDSVWSYGTLPAGEPTAIASFAAMTRNEEQGLGWKLFNLGNAEARQWITERVDSLIKSEKIGLYRQDFNIEPLNYWRNTDAPDRKGMTENLYVQGYLKYWDDLVARNPGLWIDTCASGGRRNDLETLRRSTPLLRSDRLFAPTGQQTHTYGISQWMPANGTGQLVGKSAIFGGVEGAVDPYVLRSCEAPELNLCIDVSEKNLDYDQLRKFVSQHREMGDCYFGDYYPLTPHSAADDAWMAWQFHLADKDEGFVQAFRHPAAPESITLKLKGLSPAARYRIVDVDHPDSSKVMSGADLAQGYALTVKANPGAAILRYKREP